MYIKFFFLAISLVFLNSTKVFSQADTSIIGYIKYKEIYPKSMKTDFKMLRIVTSLFSKSDTYITYFINQFEDVERTADAQLASANNNNPSEIQRNSTIEQIVEINKSKQTPQFVSTINTSTGVRKTMYTLTNLNPINHVVYDTLINDGVEFFNQFDTILGYTCKKAIINKSNVKFTVWFSPDLPFAVSPNKIFGVPGAILRISYENGQAFVATEVNTKSVASCYYKYFNVPFSNNIVSEIEHLKLINKSNDLAMNGKG